MTKRKLQAGILVGLLVGLCTAGAATISVPFVARGMGSLIPQPNGTFVVTGGGYATQLGQYTVHGIQTLQPGMPPSFYGEVTLTGANGDAIDVTVSGIMVSLPPNPAGEGQYQIVGGTGRFEGASGEGSFSAGADGTRFEGSIVLSAGP